MKKNLILIVMFLFLQGVIHNLGHPITPSLVKALEIPDYMFGLFFAAMSFGLMVGAPLWGILSDRGHRKLWIALGLSVYTLGQIGFGYSGHAVWMVIFRLFGGCGVVSAITIFTAILVEQTQAKDRAKWLAYVAASSTLGASLGYWIGGFLVTNSSMIALFGTTNLSRVFLIQAISNAFYTLLIVVLLGDVNVRLTFQQKPSMIEGLKSITKIDKRLLLFFISVTLMNMASTNLSKYIDIYFIDLGYSESDLGTYVMITGFVSLAASIFLVRFVSKMKKQLWVIAIMHILSAFIVFYVFRAEPFITIMYSVYMLYIVFRSLYVPLEQSYIAKEAKEGNYGSIMGLRQSFVSLGMVLGPVLGGFLYEDSPLALFDFNGILFLGGVSLLYVIMMMEKRHQRRIDDANHLLDEHIQHDILKSYQIQ